MRVAAIDIGSNSIHMVVAQVESDGRFRVLDRAKEMVRLGQRTLTSGRLSADAMNAGTRTLAAFKTPADRHGVVRFKAVATSAVREAKNGGDFVQRVRDEVGLRLKVIPGREEARLIYLGVRHAIDLRSEPTLIVDAGGGSVELIFTEEGRAVSLDSLKIGVTRLTERFLDDDPPSGKARDELEIIALTARYHRKGGPKDTDDGYRALSRADRCTGLLGDELGVDVALLVHDETQHADRPVPAARHAHRA